VGATDFPALNATEAIMRKTNTASVANAATTEPSVPTIKKSAGGKSALAPSPKPNDKMRPAARSKAPSKREQVLRLLRRNRGASLAELQKATGWQAHSVRGFLSGTVKKRLGLTLQSETSEKGGRRYRIAGA
jgi:hypothetical protein